VDKKGLGGCLAACKAAWAVVQVGARADYAKPTSWVHKDMVPSVRNELSLAMALSSHLYLSTIGPFFSLSLSFWRGREELEREICPTFLVLVYKGTAHFRPFFSPGMGGN